VRAFASQFAFRATFFAVILLSLASVGGCQSRSRETVTGSAHSAGVPTFDGAQALEYTAQFVALGPRYNGSQGLLHAQQFIQKQFAHDQLEADHFVPNTAVGPQAMTNYIVRFPGKKDGVIVLATHYETNYPLRNINFVGANDGGSTTGELIELAKYLRGKTLDGYSVWLVFFDGEEATQSWTTSDSLYGSRHLAAKWQSDGTLKKIKAFLLLDMIGDKNLNVLRDENSTPWLLDVVKEAATKTGNQKYFFATHNTVFDDHNPFHDRGVACADIIDLDYGPHDASHPDGYHHTAEDTMDKLSAHSLTVIGTTLLETLRLLDQQSR
jgi:glutaminyl-peptide cyclotransferase